MKQRGFTLIELIIVIIILGILAVTAAPRFMGMQADAQESALNGVRGAMESAASLVYAKSAIQGKHRAATGTVNVASSGTQNINTVFGYPAATAGTANDATLTTELQSWLDIKTSDFDFAYTATQIKVYPKGSSSDTCSVIYTEAANANSSPAIVVDASGC